MAQDFPAALRRHEFTNPRRDNWCWGLANPQALKKPYPATGNARPFHVDVPDKLFPKSDQDK